MADTEETARFSLELDSDELTKGGNRAAGTLEALRGKIKSGQQALTGMEAAFKRMNAGQVVNVQAAQALRQKIDAQKNSIAALEAKYVNAGGTFGAVAKKQSSFSQLLSRQPGVIGAVGRALGGISAPGAAAAVSIGAIALAATLAVGAIFAVGRAAVSATSEIVQFGLAHADARRNELLHLEGLTLLRHHMGLSSGSASELQAAIDRVSATSSLGRSELTGYAERLHRMGLRGDDLSEALEGTAISASVLGERWGSRFAGMTAAAIRTGGSVRRLADDVRARLGGVAARQALSLGVQMEHLREGVGSLFDDVNIEPFLRGLSQVTSLFSRGSAVGGAFRAVIAAVFNPFLAGSEDAGGAISVFVQYVTLGIVRAMLWVQRFRLAFRGLDETLGITRTIAALALGQIGIAAGVAWAMVQPFIGSLVALGTSAFATGFAILAIWTRVRSFFSETDWGALGESIVTRLVDAIVNGRPRVGNAIRSLATSATTALTEALGIASPSRVFLRFGTEIPRGLAAGVDAAAPRSDRAVERFAEGTARSFDPEAPIGGAVAASASSSSTTIGPFYIQVSGGEGAAQRIADELATLLEGLGTVRGAPT